MPESFLDNAKCPACDNVGLTYASEQVELPYFGRSLETSLRCGGCGYRHNDFVLLDTKEPTRCTLRIEREDHMSYRIVRGSSGTVRIPELGIEIAPGAAADAYITNVEGILVRVEKILGQLLRDCQDESEMVKILALQETFQAMRRGEAQPVHLILEDPFGNSRIVGEGVETVVLSEEEAATLQTGMFTYDQPITSADLDQEGEEA